MHLLYSYFLKWRDKQPVLMQSGKGWSFLCLPAEQQPDWDESLSFLDELALREPESGEPPFVGGWVGFLPYDDGFEMQWRYCDRGVARSPEGELLFFGMEPVDVEELHLPSFKMGEVKAGLSYEEYEQAILAIHEELRNGETYQVNYTLPFVADFEGDAFGLYVALFAANSADMCFYMEGENWAVASNSPERLFEVRNGVIQAQPIKGTVPADADPQFLLEDEKSYAELTMIVDLLRNDVGKVAKAGSLSVPEHQALMELKNVWHTYSTVRAELAEGVKPSEVLTALFPGGSITGCPKIRTMEIIRKLETYKRGAYCGSAGYVSINGNMDFNIMIRTATVQGDQVVFPAGGGIVMDSNPESEWEEVHAKLDTFAKIGLM